MRVEEGSVLPEDGGEPLLAKVGGGLGGGNLEAAGLEGGNREGEGAHVDERQGDTRDLRHPI